MREKLEKIGMPEIMERTGVYSITTDPTNILMWSHYADSHSGVCLRFKGKPLFEQFWTGHWMTYEDERPVVRIGEEDEESLLRKILFTKARPWDYEKEWRLVDYKGQAGVRTLRPNVLDGVILGSRISPRIERKIIASIQRSGTKIEIMRAREKRDAYGLSIGAFEPSDDGK